MIAELSQTSSAALPLSEQSSQGACVMQRFGWRRKLAESAMAAPDDTFPLKHGEFARGIVQIVRTHGRQLGDRTVLVGDNDYSPWRTCSIKALSWFFVWDIEAVFIWS